MNIKLKYIPEIRLGFQLKTTIDQSRVQNIESRILLL